MTEINLDYLKHAVLDVLDESIQEGYDLDIILKSATLVWDDTAVQVKGNDFIMIFDAISYELQDYQGYDL